MKFSENNLMILDDILCFPATEATVFIKKNICVSITLVDILCLAGKHSLSPLEIIST